MNKIYLSGKRKIVIQEYFNLLIIIYSSPILEAKHYFLSLPFVFIIFIVKWNMLIPKI